MLFSCDQSCRNIGTCGCGAFKDGVLVDGGTVRFSLLLKDDAKRINDAMFTDEERAKHRAQAYRDDMCEKMGKAWQGPAAVNNNAAIPEYTQDGRHISTLTDRERAYHTYVSSLGNAWRR